MFVAEECRHLCTCIAVPDFHTHVLPLLAWYASAIVKKVTVEFAWPLTQPILTATKLGVGL